MTVQETYLGDGAYAALRQQQGDYFEIELYTSNGITTTNSVILGPSEIVKLLSFLGSTGALK